MHPRRLERMVQLMRQHRAHLGLHSYTNVNTKVCMTLTPQPSDHLGLHAYGFTHRSGCEGAPHTRPVAPTNPVMTLTLTLTKGQGADMAMLDNSASAIVRSPEEVAAIARSSTPRRPGQVAPLPMTLTLTLALALTLTLTLTLEP
eukprot:scaffold75755_cov61-Phaeocystis_antarctica.AAC.3